MSKHHTIRVIKAVDFDGERGTIRAIAADHLIEIELTAEAWRELLRTMMDLSNLMPPRFDEVWPDASR